MCRYSVVNEIIVVKSEVKVVEDNVLIPTLFRGEAQKDPNLMKHYSASRWCRRTGSWRASSP